MKRDDVAAVDALASPPGVLEWFPLGDRELVEATLASMKALGLRRLRTGVSWADWYCEGGEAWYDWLFARLGQEEDLELLPCLNYTPPSIGEVPNTASPPRDLEAFAHFVDEVIGRYGERFEAVELWNEPNNLAEWDYTRDPMWFKFASMIGSAAHWAQHLGKKVVLGGMSPVDPAWLEMMFDRGVMQYVDVVGVHGFPGTWEKNWTSWQEQIGRVQQLLDERGSEAEIWITEVGYSTRGFREFQQVQVFIDALQAPATRIYWYGMFDLGFDRPSILGLHVDEREYHCGLKRSSGGPKLLYRLLERHGVEGAREVASWPRVSVERGEDEGALILGGAGFVGSNLANRLLNDGERVVVYDNLRRPGVEENIRWLRRRHDNLELVIGDIRDEHLLRRAVKTVDRVYHFAGQVAVTTSLDDPMDDFLTNARGTIAVLEALRARPKPPTLLFTSTNKVYGGLDGVEFEERATRYEPDDEALLERGIGEERPLSFRSPYGCSKGAADQYVIDYALTYGLPAAVFRMSCIYGPRQFGTEDQGWVAHFLLKALRDEPITIFGDGKQVRDVLFVEDLVEAFLLATSSIDQIAGQAFNIGGGPQNTMSLLELLDRIGELRGAAPEVEFDGWRPGDQRYYVSDIRRFGEATGWRPTVSVDEGVKRLHDWLVDYIGAPETSPAPRRPLQGPPPVGGRRKEVRRG